MAKKIQEKNIFSLKVIFMTLILKKISGQNHIILLKTKIIDIMMLGQELLMIGDIIRNITISEMESQERDKTYLIIILIMEDTSPTGRGPSLFLNLMMMIIEFVLLLKIQIQNIHILEKYFQSKIVKYLIKA